MTTIANAAAFLTREYELSGMKLQKILYYAQVLSLTQRGVPLFPEDFEAWRHGPVNREVWEGQIVDAPLVAEEEAILHDTWEKYGHLTAFELSDLTHADAPWRETRGDLPEYMGSDRVIQQKLIENFYLCRELIKRPDGTWEHAPPGEEAWKKAKLQLVLKRKARGRLQGEAREQFLREQVIATQRLEGITVDPAALNG